MSRPNPQSCAGVTVVEMTVVAAVFSLLALVFFQSVGMVESGNERITQHNRLYTKCQHVLNRLAQQTSGSARLYTDSAEARALFGLLEGVTAQRLTPSHLPVAVPDGILEKDTVSMRVTGNALLFLEALRPLEYVPSGQTVGTDRIDIYRVSAVYLVRKAGTVGSLDALPNGLDLVTFRSAPLIDHDQVMAIDDPLDRADVLASARTVRGVQFLFDTDAPVASALTSFDDSGGIGSAPTPYRIPADPDRGRRAFFENVSVSVATNGAPTRHGVARFSQTDKTGDGFPHGFEVRVHGKSGARAITMHLVLASRSTPSGDVNYTNLSASAVTRDF